MPIFNTVRALSSYPIYHINHMNICPNLLCVRITTMALSTHPTSTANDKCIPNWPSSTKPCQRMKTVKSRLFAMKRKTTMNKRQRRHLHEIDVVTESDIQFPITSIPPASCSPFSESSDQMLSSFESMSLTTLSSFQGPININFDSISFDQRAESSEDILSRPYPSQIELDEIETDHHMVDYISDKDACSMIGLDFLGDRMSLATTKRFLERSAAIALNHNF